MFGNGSGLVAQQEKVYIYISCIVLFKFDLYGTLICTQQLV